MKTICGSCGKPVIGNGWFHSRLRVVVHPSLDCMRNLKGEDVTGHTMQLIENTSPQTTDREAMGCLAYETWMDKLRFTEAAPLIYPSWECLHPAQQKAWREIGALLWQAGFEAGSDFMSILMTNIWSPLPEGTEF